MTFTPRVRIVVLACVVAAACGAALLWAPHTPDGLRHLFASAGSAAPWMLLAAWVVLTPALFSGTALAAATGLVLGPALGVPVALAGATLGAGAAFALARSTSGTDAVRLLPERVRRLEERLEKRPLLGIAAIRAAPGVPATLLNYAAGFSRVRARHFLAGTTLGGAPRVAAYAAIGGGVGHVGSLPAMAAIMAAAGLALAAAFLVARRLTVLSRARP